MVPTMRMKKNKGSTCASSQYRNTDSVHSSRCTCGVRVWYWSVYVMTTRGEPPSRRNEIERVCMCVCLGVARCAVLTVFVNQVPWYDMDNVQHTEQTQRNAKHCCTTLRCRDEWMVWETVWDTHRQSATPTIATHKRVLIKHNHLYTTSLYHLHVAGKMHTTCTTIDKAATINNIMGCGGTDKQGMRRWYSGGRNKNHMVTDHHTHNPQPFADMWGGMGGTMSTPHIT